ncbi:A1S_2505 family phage non-structural protein [Mycolicibacterium porcinum]|uniref:A1S_2505 family phage non-structural protein n=1 Tax=Mycolicibacterium porcinum TaxID=39693 RepID=UPI00084876DC|nr:hypothetical protein [Mycolicibacterium porcinum]ODR25797.1 hypothetical protein BHQ19_10220 [Mycolicibacterium porcinum]
MIDKLEPHQIFVFGSNEAGHHFGGAAAQAHRDFGAEWGVGEGLTGRSYAFPTLAADMQRVSNTQLKASRLRLYRTAQAHPDAEFLLTKVGCGIAGFSEDTMRKLFRNAPSNIIKPEDWR